MDVKAQRLEATIAELERRYGHNTLIPLSALPTSECGSPIQTGIPQLDHLFTFPRGQLTVVSGVMSSGRTTIALGALVGVQHNKERAVYVDLAHVFDSDYANACGVQLDQLLLVRPFQPVDGIEIASELVARYSLGALVIDSTYAHLDAGLLSVMRRLLSHTRRSNCIVIWVTLEPNGFDVSAMAGAVLKTEHVRWLTRRSGIDGFEARVTFAKLVGNPGGHYTIIPIAFAGAERAEANA